MILQMLQHMFSSYGEIEEIGLEINTVNMMGSYNLAETLVRLIDKIEKGREFSI